MGSITLKKWPKGSTSRTRICLISQESLAKIKVKLTKLDTTSIPCWFPSTVGKKPSWSSSISAVTGEGYVTIAIRAIQSQSLRKNSIHTRNWRKTKSSSGCTRGRLSSSMSSTKPSEDSLIPLTVSTSDSHSKTCFWLSSNSTKSKKKISLDPRTSSATGPPSFQKTSSIILTRTKAGMWKWRAFYQLPFQNEKHSRTTLLTKKILWCKFGLAWMDWEDNLIGVSLKSPKFLTSMVKDKCFSTPLTFSRWSIAWKTIT